MKTAQQLIFVNYFDVWGNEDSYDVNDVFKHKIEGLVPETEIDVLQLLVDNDIVYGNVNLGQVVIEIDEHGAEITERQSGRPIGRVQWEG